MNQYLKLTVKRYLILCLSLSFFCIILSPHIKNCELSQFPRIAFSIFIYRFGVISIFSLLFAALSTIQTYEKQNISVALSMSGMHSFRFLGGIFYFSIFLACLCLVINQFFLAGSIQTLGKETFLSSYSPNLQVCKVDKGHIFFTKEMKNFTYINNNKDVIYAASASFEDSAIKLSYADHFQKTNGEYEKIASYKSLVLDIDPKSLKLPVKIKNSATLTSLFHFFTSKKGIEPAYRQEILTVLAYRSLLPLLHIFAASLAAIFGLSYFFRSKTYSTLFVCSFTSLLFFYILECSSILGAACIISPLYFIIIALILPIVFPCIFYLKKV